MFFFWWSKHVASKRICSIKEVSSGEQAIFLEGKDERKIKTIQYCGTDGNGGLGAFLIDFAPISYGILGDLLLIMLRM